MQLHSCRLPLLTEFNLLWTFLRSSSYLLYMDLGEHRTIQNMTALYGTEMKVGLYIYLFIYFYMCVCACKTFRKG